MQNQPEQNIANPQQGVESELQPNRSDLQNGQQAQSIYGKGSFNQQDLSAPRDKLRVETATSTVRTAGGQSVPAEPSITGFIIASVIVLAVVTGLVIIAMKSSSNSKINALPVTDRPHESNSKTTIPPKKKKKKQTRKKRIAK
jgi:hypothetical protein